MNTQPTPSVRAIAGLVFICLAPPVGRRVRAGRDDARRNSGPPVSPRDAVRELRREGRPPVAQGPLRPENQRRQTVARHHQRAVRARTGRQVPPLRTGGRVEPSGGAEHGRGPPHRRLVARDHAGTVPLQRGTVYRVHADQQRPAKQCRLRGGGHGRHRLGRDPRRRRRVPYQDQDLEHLRPEQRGHGRALVLRRRPGRRGCLHRHLGRRHCGARSQDRQLQGLSRSRRRFSVPVDAR